MRLNWKVIPLAMAAIVMVSTPAHAQDLLPGQQMNGCGSGWSLYFVPNRIPLAACEFKAACDGHDICYGACLKGGTLFGKRECDYLRCRPGGDLFRKEACDDGEMTQLTAQAVNRRASCDSSLCDSIRAANKGKMICEAFAVIYREAVKEFAKGAFSGVGSNAAKRQSQEAYIGAISEFIQRGSDAEFKAFLEQADQGRLAIDFNEPLDYAQGSGLKNKK